MRHLSLEDLVGVAWIVTLMAFTALPAINQTNPPAAVRLIGFVVVSTGCIAFSVAVIGSLLLAFRRLIQPREEDAADYDDERIPGRGADHSARADRLPNEKPRGPAAG